MRVRVVIQALQVRLPVELHAALRAASAESGRSLNAEIVFRLRRSFEGWRQ